MKFHWFILFLNIIVVSFFTTMLIGGEPNSIMVFLDIFIVIINILSMGLQVAVLVTERSK